MHVLSIFPSYVIWHYSTGFKEFFINIKNILGAVYRFFSINLLLRTLFLPWRRISEPHGSIFDFENFFSSVVVNGLMRFVGFIIRACTILFGLIVWLLALSVCLLLILLWPVLPVLTFVLIIFSVISLF